MGGVFLGKQLIATFFFTFFLNYLLFVLKGKDFQRELDIDRCNKEKCLNANLWRRKSNLEKKLLVFPQLLL